MIFFYLGELTIIYDHLQWVSKSSRINKGRERWTRYLGHTSIHHMISLSFIPCHRQGFDPKGIKKHDVIPQVICISLREHADNKSVRIVLFFLSSISWVAYALVASKVNKYCCTIVRHETRKN